MKTRTILVGAGIALALVALLGGGWLLVSQLGDASCWQSGFGMNGTYGFPWGPNSYGGILMFLLWVVIIGGIALLAVDLSRQGKRAAVQGESPLEILGRRYASGELDRDEFERMKELLSR